MKRTLSAILMLLLLASAAAEVPIFSFRNGIEWGLSRQAVIEAEGNPTYETDWENGMDVVVLENVMNEGAACDIVYLFYEDGLSMVRAQYDTSDGSITFDDLMASLCEKYGEATELDTSLLNNSLRDDEEMPDRFYGWALDSETLIYLIESEDEDSIQIIYSDLSGE